jgi:hypothetical protein
MALNGSGEIRCSGEIRFFGKIGFLLFAKKSPKSCTKLFNEMALNGSGEIRCSGEIRFFGKIGFLLKTYNHKKLIRYYNESL